jgi:DNA-binding NarL/FixJ family response regulator
VENILKHESQHGVMSHSGVMNITATTAPRVLLADDQAEMLQTITLILGGGFDIVGTAENGSRAIELATKLSPDVLVLDICMPVVNGIEAACLLKERGSRAKVIFLTVHTDPEFVEAALSAGALGYVLKPFLASDLVPAIWAVTRGLVFISSPAQFEQPCRSQTLESGRSLPKSSNKR